MHTHKLKDSQSDVSAHQSIFNAVSGIESRGEKLNNSSVFHFCRRPGAQVSPSTGKRSEEGGLASTLFAVSLPPRRQTPLNRTPLKQSSAAKNRRMVKEEAALRGPPAQRRYVTRAAATDRENGKGINHSAAADTCRCDRGGHVIHV